ncbi:aldehyde-activating protein [Aquitalea palustris]|uniref:Aldehyde-activating protein n=1 Tax=Aquitalea palustris TaxID=2480983 RepID=A0A454JG60_9NEIS|nr:aldehyde-activating protein [Aquitalea palustris]RMC95176.1 aldehyde-activating protein [Aquitalea palustris]
MHKLTGACHCGNIHIAIALTQSPDSYAPRACDCDFCRKHGASYLSDPHGSMQLEVHDADFMVKYRHGSQLADFLLCSRCGVLIGVLYQDGSRLYGTVNCAALQQTAALGAPRTVSPKRLASSEKTARWSALWFPDVRICLSAT